MGHCNPEMKDPILLLLLRQKDLSRTKVMDIVAAGTE